MATQLDLDSVQAREEGIDNAEEGAGANWIADAIGAIATVAKTRQFFSSDDVRQIYFDPPEPRAWGAAFRAAASLGIIEPTDRYCIPNRISSHRRPMRIWRSRAA